MKQRNGIAALAGFLAIWTAMVGGFDAYIAWSFSNQLDAATYVRTDGRMTKSRVQKTTDSDGNTSYHVDLEYRYEVDGRAYDSERHHFGMVGTGTSGHAERIVKRFPVGDTVDVFYDPDRPARSVLDPSPDRAPWFMTLFLAPFNAFGLILLVGLLRLAGEHVLARPTGFSASVSGDLVRIRLSGGVPAVLTCGIGAYTAAAFVASFVVAFGNDGFATGRGPVVQAHWVVFGVGVAGVVAGAAWQMVRGKYLVIDTAQRAIVPSERGVTVVERRIEADGVKAVEVVQGDRKSDAANRQDVSVVLRLKGEIEKSVWLKEKIFVRSKAEKFARFVREGLGLAGVGGSG